MRLATGVLLLAAMTLTGCESPEATRTRGGGPGGDKGNRPATVRMHEGSEQFWETPVRVPGNAAPLEPARHARQFSQP
jgi:hypothetical protein